MARRNIWRKAQSTFWPIHLFTDYTKWCEAKVQTSTNISFCWVFKAIKVTRTVSVWQSFMGNVSLSFFFTPKWNVRVVFMFRQKLGNLKHPQPHEISQVWEIQRVVYQACVCIRWMCTNLLSMWLWEKWGLWLSLTMILWEVAVVVSHYWIKKAGTFFLLLLLLSELYFML